MDKPKPVISDQYSARDLWLGVVKLGAIAGVAVSFPGLGWFAACMSLFVGALTLLSLLFGRTKEKQERLAWCAALFFFGGIGAGIGMEYNIQVRKAELEPVIRALEAFHAARDRYPAKAGELVPQFLPELPGDMSEPPSMQRGTFYFHHEPIGKEPESFSLMFGALGGTPLRCSYHSTTKGWRTWD